MTFPQQPGATLTPDSLAALATASPQEQFEFFRGHSDSPVLDAWLLAQLQPLTPSSQALLRLARQAFSYFEGTDGRQHLLFGVPLVVNASNLDVNWAALRSELSQSLASALLPMDSDVILCSQPLKTSVLHHIGASELGSWSEALFNKKSPFSGLYEPGESGAHVWIGQVSVPHAQRQDLEDVFFKVGVNWAAKIRPVLMRLEGLAEQSGARLRLFPPTAIWNSLSLSRLAHARMQLEPFRKQAADWSAKRDGSDVLLMRAGSPLMRFEFPEELDVDLAPLFKGWSKLIF